MSETMHSKKTMASYSAGFYVNEFISAVLIFMLFYFYNVEVGLPAWMTGLALGIYALWDAFNDPMIGYLTDRPFRFTKKWGRRFPWIIIGYIPMLLSFVLIFSPPNVNAQEQPWVIFGWLVFTLCLFDVCETLFTVNYYGLFPDKFRGKEERLQVTKIAVSIGIIGVVFGNLLPPMIVVFGDVGTFTSMAWICVTINFFCWFLMFYGARDDKEAVENYLAKYEEREKEPLLNTLKKTFKQKAFIAFLLFMLTYFTVTSMVQACFIYWIRFIIFGEAGDILYVMVMLLIGTIIGLLLAAIYNKKTGDNRKTLIYASVVFILLTFIFTVIVDLMGLLILGFLWGMGLGAFWVMRYPAYADVIDEAISITGTRREGFYFGFIAFIGNLAKALQAFFFGLVLELTGFVETESVQTPLANSGILLLFGVIPAIIMSIGLIIFWRFYDITPEKSKKIKERLMELNV